MTSPIPTETVNFDESPDDYHDIGVIRTLAEFSMAAYALQPWEINTAYNDWNDNADVAYQAIIEQQWQTNFSGAQVSSTFWANDSDTDSVVELPALNGLKDGFFTQNNAAVLLAQSGDALVLAFRGTNDNRFADADSGVLNALDNGNTIHPDKDQWGDSPDQSMSDHYALFEPVIEFVDDYAADPANGITQIFVTGHSLGGAMAIKYMADHPAQPDSTLQYQAVTFAAPAFTEGYLFRSLFEPDERIIQLEIEHDPVPMTWDALFKIDRPGQLIEFAGNETSITPDYYFGLGYVNDNNHAMAYYQEIAQSLGDEAWQQILQQTGDFSVLVGASRAVTERVEIFAIDRGDDVLESTDLSDYHLYYGGIGDDQIIAGSGNNQLFGSHGNDCLNGGDGIDISVYSGERPDYQLKKNDDQTFTLTHLTGDEGEDTLENIERLQFKDVSVALDIDGHAGQVAKILGSAFGAEFVSHQEYAGIGLNLLDEGMSYPDLAGLAIQAAGAQSHEDVVQLLWTNVVGTAPQPEQAQPFIDLLDQGMSIGELGVLAADTELNQQQIHLTDLTLTGLQFWPV